VDLVEVQVLKGQLEVVPHKLIHYSMIQYNTNYLSDQNVLELHPTKVCGTFTPEKGCFKRNNVFMRSSIDNC
jgi:hypothetical protein